MIAEHAVPAHVPEARGRVTHYVCYDYPKQRGVSVVTSMEVPCVGEREALSIELANKKAGMVNVRILTAEEYRSTRGAVR